MKIQSYAGENVMMLPCLLGMQAWAWQEAVHKVDCAAAMSAIDKLVHAGTAQFALLLQRAVAVHAIRVWRRVQEQLPRASRNLPEIFLLDGSGLKFAPRWVAARPGATPVEGCRLTVQIVCDLKIGAMPTSLMHFVFRVLGPLVYRLAKHVIVSYVQQPGAQLHARVQQRAAVYQRTRELFAETLARQGKDTALHIHKG